MPRLSSLEALNEWLDKVLEELTTAGSVSAQCERAKAHRDEQHHTLEQWPAGPEGASLLEQTETNDLAVVKITAGEALKPLAFRKSATRLGEDIVAVGYPLATLTADSLKITTGNVNSLAGICNDTSYVRARHRSSRGTLLLGITSATLSKRTADEISITAQNVNFAIRASVAERSLHP
nr:S1C family serine protease [Rhizobium fabae]